MSLSQDMLEVFFIGDYDITKVITELMEDDDELVTGDE